MSPGTAWQWRLARRQGEADGELALMFVEVEAQHLAFAAPGVAARRLPAELRQRRRVEIVHGGAAGLAGGLRLDDAALRLVEDERGAGHRLQPRHQRHV